MFGIAYAKATDETCSATTIRSRRDEWIALGLFQALEQIELDEARARIAALEATICEQAMKLHLIEGKESWD